MDEVKKANTVSDFQQIYNELSELDRGTFLNELEPFEAAQIAAQVHRNHIQQERNNLIRAALVIHNGPGVLESIAMMMGATPNGTGPNIPGALSEIADAIRNQE